MRNSCCALRKERSRNTRTLKSAPNTRPKRTPTRCPVTHWASCALTRRVSTLSKKINRLQEHTLSDVGDATSTALGETAGSSFYNNRGPHLDCLENENVKVGFGGTGEENRSSDTEHAKSSKAAGIQAHMFPTELIDLN